MTEGGASTPWYRRRGSIAVSIVVSAAVGGTGIALVGGSDSGDDRSATTEPTAGEAALECRAPRPGPEPPAPAPIDGPRRQTVRPEEPNRPDTRESETSVGPGAEEQTASTLVHDVAGLDEAVCVEGLAAVVTDAEMEDGRVVVVVVIENQGDDPRSSSPLDWRLVTEDGELGPEPNTARMPSGCGTWVRGRGWRARSCSRPSAGPTS